MTSTAPTGTLSTFKPALSPPPGEHSNPDNPPSLAHVSTITIAICAPIVTLFFLLRCYVRLWVKRLFTWEDLICITLWAGSIAFFGTTRNTMSHGGGLHMWDITAEKSHEMAFWFNVSAIMYGFMIGLAKVAVLVLYRRVFSPHKWSAFDIWIVCLMIAIIGFYVSTSIVKIFECWPRNKIWNKSLPGKCIEMKWVLNMSGIFNTVTDWIILLLPVHAVTRLHMKKSKKILVFLAFTFGACAPIFATVGLVVRFRNTGAKDVSWKQPEILLWGMGELTSSVLILCFPELAALFRLSSYMKQNTPHKPGPATLKEWSQPRSKGPSDPYMTKSLMKGTINIDEGNYIELQDTENEVRVGVEVKPGSRLDARDNQVLVQTEVRIETHNVV